MMTRRGRAALPLLLCAGAPGCGYLAARGRDLSDIVTVGASAGGGIGIRLGATRLLAVEVMAQKDEGFAGWHGRNVRWRESSYGTPFSHWRMPTLDEETPPPRHWYDVVTTSRRRTQYPNRPEIEDRRHTLFIWSGGSGGRWVDVLNLEAGISALAGGLELSLRPGELVDFLVGWFGLDLGEDDGLAVGFLPAPRSEPEQELLRL